MNLSAVRALLFGLLLLPQICYSSQPSPISPDSLTEKHNELFKNGATLIKKHIFFDDRKRSSGSKARKDLHQGITYLDEVISINPKNWAAFWFRGKAFQALGLHDTAYDSFQSAYALEPNAEVGRELTIECLETGKFEEAARVASSVIQLNPEDHGLQANLALAFVMNGQITDAQKAIEKSLEINPTDEISKAIRDRIEDILNGRRPQPKTTQDLLK